MSISTRDIAEATGGRPTGNLELSNFLVPSDLCLRPLVDMQGRGARAQIHPSTRRSYRSVHTVVVGLSAEYTINSRGPDAWRTSVAKGRS